MIWKSNNNHNYNKVTFPQTTINLIFPQNLQLNSNKQPLTANKLFSHLFHPNY